MKLNTAVSFFSQHPGGTALFGLGGARALLADGKGSSVLAWPGRISPKIYTFGPRTYSPKGPGRGTMSPDQRPADGVGGYKIVPRPIPRRRPRQRLPRDPSRPTERLKVGERAMGLWIRVDAGRGPRARHRATRGQKINLVTAFSGRRCDAADGTCYSIT